MARPALGVLATHSNIEETLKAFGQWLCGKCMDLHVVSRACHHPVDIRRPSSGVKLLGGAVSKDTYFISGLAMRRAVNAVDLMSLLP
ncbi:hypothetical protein Tco_0011916 [Tanacetum coccineum]